MKCKVINIAGIIAMLLLAIVQSAMILWNYGRTGLGVYDPYYDLGVFSWSTIVGTDWLGWSLCTVWFFLLVIPWIQSFVAMGKQRCFRSTLSGKSGFFHVLFTVFNVSLIVGCLFLLLSQVYLYKIYLLANPSYYLKQYNGKDFSFHLVLKMLQTHTEISKLLAPSH